MDSTNDSDSALKSREELLSEKEQELQGRIDEFNKQVELFDKANPRSGKSSDILYLNVGGEAKIAVRRSLLTQFEESLLAAKFSGRWDDALEKDSEGRIFVDQDPRCFQLLISFLRARDNSRGTDFKAKLRFTPTATFCAMLESYGLMPYVFPAEWAVVKGDVERNEPDRKMSNFTTKSRFGLLSLRPSSVCDLRTMKFTVSVPRDSPISVGWITDKHGDDRYADFIGQSQFSFGIQPNVKWFQQENRIISDFYLDDDGVDPIVIECVWDEASTYTIRVVGAPRAEYSCQLPKDSVWYPAISWHGEICHRQGTIPFSIADVEYACPSDW